MTTCVLPPPDVFASCPFDGKILDHYAGTFEAVFISLNPFFKPIAIDRAEFKPGTYPNRAKIVASCGAVRWSEVLRRIDLSSLAAVDIGLRTRIGGLRKDLEKKEFSSAIDELAESEGILSPIEGHFSDLLNDKVLQSIQSLGYEWLWIGDEFDTERKLKWIDDLLNQDDGLTRGRVNVFTPDKQLLWTTHWDRHFSFLCSSYEQLAAIRARSALEGFFCNSLTEVYWSVHPDNGIGLEQPQGF